MLDTTRGERKRGPVRPGAASATPHGATEFLLEVLGSARSYDAPIRQAERDGDFELADFLRDLQRQDLARIGEAARLLRRPFGPARVDAEKENQAC
jgi:hypothetical protein